MSTIAVERKRILVVEDDAGIRNLLRTILSREGLTVDLAADGYEAVALMEATQYPVILLDLMLPRMDGYAVIAWIRDHPSKEKPLVLVATAYADDFVRRVDSNFVAGIVRKPFDIRELAAIVRQLVYGTDNEDTLRLPPDGAFAKALADMRTRQSNGSGNHQDN